MTIGSSDLVMSVLDDNGAKRKGDVVPAYGVHDPESLAALRHADEVLWREVSHRVRTIEPSLCVKLDEYLFTRAVAFEPHRQIPAVSMGRLHEPAGKICVFCMASHYFVAKSHLSIEKLKCRARSEGFWYRSSPQAELTMIGQGGMERGVHRVCRRCRLTVKQLQSDQTGVGDEGRHRHRWCSAHPGRRVQWRFCHSACS